MIYWVIGLEGCGHHGLSAVANDILSRTCPNYMGPREIKKIIEDPNPVSRSRRLAAYFKDVPKRSTHYVDPSFPCGLVRRKLSDQKDIIAIYHQLRKYREVKLIHLVRCPFNTINSHPEWDGGLIGHARVLRLVQSRIDEQLAKFPERIHKVTYEKIPDSAAALSSIFDVPLDCITRALKRKFKLSKKDYKKLLTSETIGQLVSIWNDEHSVAP